MTTRSAVLAAAARLIEKEGIAGLSVREARPEDLRDRFCPVETDGHLGTATGVLRGHGLAIHRRGAGCATYSTKN